MKKNKDNTLQRGTKTPFLWTYKNKEPHVSVTLWVQSVGRWLVILSLKLLFLHSVSHQSQLSTYLGDAHERLFKRANLVKLSKARPPVSYLAPETCRVKSIEPSWVTALSQPSSSVWSVIAKRERDQEKKEHKETGFTSTTITKKIFRAETSLSNDCGKLYRTQWPPWPFF